MDTTNRADEWKNRNKDWVSALEQEVAIMKAWEIDIQAKFNTLVASMAQLSQSCSNMPKNFTHA